MKSGDLGMAFQSMSKPSLRSLGGEYSIGNFWLNESNTNYFTERYLFSLRDALGRDFDFRNDEVRANIEEFYLYKQNLPSKLDSALGSTNSSDLLKVFMLTKLIKPSFILESGVFVGGSLHMFDEVFKSTPLVGLDPNLDNLAFTPSRATLLKDDFSKLDRDLVVGKNAMGFMDDHINPSDRIIQASALGFKWLIIDDSPDIGKLQPYVWPALPSLPMILSDNLADDTVFRWKISPNDWKEYVFKSSHVLEAKGLIESAWQLNFDKEITGIASDKWLVKLK